MVMACGNVHVPREYPRIMFSDSPAFVQYLSSLLLDKYWTSNERIMDKNLTYTKVTPK